MARREYRTTFRPFKDSDQEVGIQWYKTAGGAPDLGRASSVGSLDWLALGYDRREVQLQPGEVVDAPRPYSAFPAPLFLDYAHVCGTDEEFRDGATFDPTLDVKYDEQGLPLCCGGPAVMRLGLVLGFRVQPIYNPGGDCDSSQLAQIGDECEATIAPGAQQWWAFDDVAPSFFTLDILSVDPNLPLLLWASYYGGSCAFKFFQPLVPFVFSPVPTADAQGKTIATTFGRGWVVVYNNYLVPITYRFRLV